MSGITYLGSPYSHPDPAVMLQRFHRVVREAAKLMDAGETVFCPIAHSHPIGLELGKAVDHEFWMRQDIPILAVCARIKVLCLDGWRESRGLAQEINTARALYKPVFYIRDEDIIDPVTFQRGG